MRTKNNLWKVIIETSFLAEKTLHQSPSEVKGKCESQRKYSRLSEEPVFKGSFKHFNDCENGMTSISYPDTFRQDSFRVSTK